MNAIRYFTKSGNTEKLAKGIAETVGVEALSIDTPLSEKVDILFLGTSYYAFDTAPEIKKFLAENKDKIGKVVCFGTSAMMKSMIKPMKKTCSPLGIKLEEQDFHCRGQFLKAHPGRPNANDIENCKKFVKKYL